MQVLAGDLSGARKNLSLCKEGKELYGRTVALIAVAWIEWAAGNHAEAERAMTQVQALPKPDGASGWGAKLMAAQLLAKLGHADESERLVQEVKAELTAQSPSLFHAHVEQRQAENATARGDWAAAKRHAEAVRRLLPSDAWQHNTELHTVDAVLALADGNHARAIELASTLHKQSRERGQVLVELQMHSLFPPGVMPGDCSAAQRQALMARTGMRGVSLDWLMRGLKRESRPETDLRIQALASNTEDSRFSKGSPSPIDR
jgi:ATP/maltotriose-dependent transcriptional regulator MalT